MYLPVPSGVVNTAGTLFALVIPSMVVLIAHSYDVPGKTPSDSVNVRENEVEPLVVLSSEIEFVSEPPLVLVHITS